MFKYNTDEFNQGVHIRELINYLDYKELLKLQYDLKHGGVHLKKLVEQRIKELESSPKKYCAGCGREIDPSSPTTQTLIFGPPDFKKKATFCAQDCLEYFLNELKTLKGNQRNIKNNK